MDNSTAKASNAQSAEDAPVITGETSLDDPNVRGAEDTIDFYEAGAY